MRTPEAVKPRPQAEVKVNRAAKPVDLGVVPGFEPKTVFVKGADQKMTDRPKVQKLGALEVKTMKTDSDAKMNRTQEDICKRSHVSYNNTDLCC